MTPLEERFWAKVDKSGECWEWTAARDRGGYGAIKVSGRMLRAHRVAYELVVGPIAAAMTVDHICFNRACVNPAHLRVLDAQENRRRQRRALSDCCHRGHKYTSNSAHVGPDGRSRRVCRVCVADRDSRRTQSGRRRAAA